MMHLGARMAPELLLPPPLRVVVPIRCRPLVGVWVVLWIGAWFAPALAQEPVSAQLFDTRASSRTEWSADAVSSRRNWSLLPEDKTNYTFKGDAVLANGKVGVVLRRKGRGAEVYATGANGLALQAELVPSGKALATALSSLRIEENN